MTLIEQINAKYSAPEVRSLSLSKGNRKERRGNKELGTRNL